MKIKHKLIQDFQFVSPDKKIFILKNGTILEEYKYKVKNETIDIDKDLIDQNPEFFEIIDWKSELLSYLKVNKISPPSQIQKKMIPFIEDIILSSIPQSQNLSIDESIIKELERKESDLKNREKRISDKEEEIEIRLSRVDKREESYKEDLKSLDKKEDELREISKDLTNKQLDLEDKEQKLNERERNHDLEILDASKNIDKKYEELQIKIDKDLKELSKREKELELKNKELKLREDSILEKESQIEDLVRNHQIKIDETKGWEEDVKRLHGEIKEWEKINWKLRRRNPPPSAITD